MEGYFIEKHGDEYKTVFPEAESKDSQNHPSIEDALSYIEELGITFSYLQLHGVKRVCSECRDKGYIVRRDGSTIYVERCDLCETYDSDRDAARHVFYEAEKGI